MVLIFINFSLRWEFFLSLELMCLSRQVRDCYELSEICADPEHKAFISVRQWKFLYRVTLLSLSKELLFLIILRVLMAHLGAMMQYHHLKIFSRIAIRSRIGIIWSWLVSPKHFYHECCSVRTLSVLNSVLSLYLLDFKTFKPPGISSTDFLSQPWLAENCCPLPSHQTSIPPGFGCHGLDISQWQTDTIYVPVLHF